MPDQRADIERYPGAQRPTSVTTRRGDVAGAAQATSRRREAREGLQPRTWPTGCRVGDDGGRQESPTHIRDSTSKHHTDMMPAANPKRAVWPGEAASGNDIASAQSGPDERLRGDRERVEYQRAELPKLQRHLVCAELGRAHAGCHRRRTQKSSFKAC